jgi:hypothetical protein
MLVGSIFGDAVVKSDDTECQRSADMHDVVLQGDPRSCHNVVLTHWMIQ